MMDITLDNNMDIELEFETARQDYLRDLDNLRKKYAEKLSELTLAYGSTAVASH